MRILKFFFFLIFIGTSYFNLQAQLLEPELFSEIPPEYPGGTKELLKFIANNTKYPKKAQEKGIKETVVVGLIIEPDGTLSNIKLVTDYKYNSDFDFCEEAIRVISMMPKWKPGQTNGKNVRTKFIIPVMFPPDSTFNSKSNAKKQNLETNNTSNSYAQLDRFYLLGLPKYSFTKSLSDYDLYFFLCEDGSYEIRLEWRPSGDVLIAGYPISMGMYKIENNIILLTDSFTKCKMSFQLETSNLKPLQTFSFMKDLAFKDFYLCGSSIEPDYLMTETTAEKLVSDFERKNPFTERLHRFTPDGLIKVHPLKAGLYRYGFFSHEKFELTLDADNKYEFCFKVWESSFIYNTDPYLYLTISSGIWARQGNILTLWDINLQHNFYGLIRKDGSIELLFFRWGEDMIFKKI